MKKYWLMSGSAKGELFKQLVEAYSFDEAIEKARKIDKTITQGKVVGEVGDIKDEERLFEIH